MNQIAPTGYVLLPDLPAAFLRNATAWGELRGTLPFDPKLIRQPLPGDHGLALFRDVDPLDAGRRTQWRAAQEKFWEWASPKISAGEMSAVGITVEGGEIIEIYPQSWLVQVVQKGGFKWPIELGIRGESIAAVRGHLPSVQCIPMVSLNVLAKCLDATHPPSEPECLPVPYAEWLEGKPAADFSDFSPIEFDALNRAIWWMKGYATGFVQRKGKPTRDETIRLCQQEAGCTSREAMVAWKKLPDDQKNPPRTRKAE